MCISQWVGEPNGMWCIKAPWGSRVLFIWSSSKRSVEDPKGKVTPKEVNGSGGRLTQPSPAFGGSDPAWRRLFIPPLGHSCFLSDLHLNKQIRNVICSQAENRAKIPQGTGDSPAAGVGRGSEQETEGDLLIRSLISCPANNPGWAVLTRHWFLRANYRFMQ